MSLYTKLDENTIQQIVQQFDIAAITKWKLLVGGSENTNYYLATTNREYVLTICERQSFKEATILTNLLKHLEDHHFKTTKIVQNKVGQNRRFYEDKPILLKEYISGKVIEHFKDEILEKLGASIGHLHQIPPPDYLRKDYSYGQQTFPQLIGKIDHPFIPWLSNMHQYIKENLSPDLPKALIHGDVFFNNVIITKNDIPVIIDFEGAAYYYRIFDIGMAIVGSCKEYGKINFSKAQQLLKGYQSVIQLESIEQEKLNAFIIYAATATAFWRFRQFNLFFPNKDYQNTYLEMKNIVEEMKGAVWRGYF